MSQPLAFRVALDDPYEVALERVTLALKEEGFGVLTEIDVKATMKEKLDADFRPYTILGACNPPLAHRALSNEPQIGLMLPCNVTVEATEDGGSLVSIVNPEAVLSINVLADSGVVCSVASEARVRLERVAAALSK
jgi:uncharacterized protein (DUF302 family)